MSTVQSRQRALKLHAFNDTVSVFALPVSLVHSVSIAVRVVFSHASYIFSVSNRPNSPAFASKRLTITCTASSFCSLSAETEPSTSVKHDDTLSQALEVDGIRSTTEATVDSGSEKQPFPPGNSHRSCLADNVANLPKTLPLSRL